MAVAVKNFSRGDVMNKALMFFGGIGLGMGLMYIFDPDRGGTRRALIRDKAVGLSHDVSDMVQGKATHLRNRAYGLMHEARSLMPERQQTENVSPDNVSGAGQP